MVLSMFNSITRPDVMAWYARTRFYHIIELTAWQLYPSSSTYNKLHPRYRPIKAQLENAHPLIIDWIHSHLSGTVLYNFTRLIRTLIRSSAMQ